MSGPTGPHDAGDADDSAARTGEGAPDAWEEGTAPHQGIGGQEQEWAMGEADWRPEREHKESDRRRMMPALLVGALAGMVALSLIWAATAMITGTDSGPGTTASVTSTVTAGTEPGHRMHAARRPSLEDRCQQAQAELVGPLQAAVPALDQWEIHVGAMNKLVLGVITLQQATAFWDRTRVGARRNLHGFYSALRVAPFAGVGCPSPGALRQASADLRSCANHVAHERRALDAARIAMQTWRTHVRHMEMLRMGHMSAAAATQKWLASWRQGVRELQVYRRAVRAVDDSC